MKPTRRSLLAAILCAPALPAVLREPPEKPKSKPGPTCHRCGAPMAWFAMRGSEYCDDVFSACSIDAAHNTAGKYLDAVRSGKAYLGFM